MTIRNIALLLLGLAGAATASAAPAEKANGAAKELWENHCQLCHGERGAPPPVAKNMGVADLSVPKWQASRTDAQIRTVISEGKKDTLMQPFKDELTDEEIDTLVKYVRTLAKKPEKKTN